MIDGDAAVDHRHAEENVRHFVYMTVTTAASETGQARITHELAAQLREEDAELLGLDGRTRIVKAALELLHRRAAEERMARSVDDFYLVENMPDGNAQRPGDIVTSMSGQTIEIINTDAEGRLVLADVLWHVAKKFKPKFMVDLATLTGAIMVALGTEHAGLFSNNDELADRLIKAGVETGEKVWRMPLGPEYDKLIDSQFADMKNTGGRHGGSITAAQFLQRFVDNTPWAHLDIAGTAMGAPKTEINQSWGSGYGVRLLDRLVADHYEAKYEADDRSPVLPFAEHVGGERAAAAAREVARARLAGGGAGDLARSAPTRWMRICGPIAMILPAARDLARGDAEEQPIMLAVEEDNPNRANVRFLIDNAALPQDATPMNGWCCCSTATTRTR